MSGAERRHEAPGGDQRSAFQRDLDRIIYSSEYRRLAGVTQVVSALEGHVFHNRLTHTLKVAQVARRLAERLQSVHQLTDDELNPDVAEAAAHAHDIGHPPFGHVAEKKLQELMAPACGNDHFEGNAQSFRIVTTLASHDRNYVGLNLTRRTLDAILKYPWQVARDPEKKWGAYESETGDFQFARVGKIESRAQSLEASIMDWADDITYAVHDVEDLFRAGVAPMDRLRMDAEARLEFTEWVHDRWRARGKDVSTTDIEAALTQVTRLVPFTRPFDATARDRVRLRSYSSALINRYIAHESSLHWEAGTWSLSISDEARLEVDVLKELTWRFMIEGPALAAQQHGQISAVEYVYGVLFEASDSTTHVNRRVMPIRAREALERARRAGDDSDRTRARIVADALCSMTEDELLRFYSRITGHSLGSVLDAIV